VLTQKSGKSVKTIGVEVWDYFLHVCFLLTFPVVCEE
jgi:hypothetical protein